MKYVPHDYQCSTMRFMLKNKFGALFLDPGMGKTSTSLSVINMLVQSGSNKAALIIAPLRVVYAVWPAEIQKWDQLRGMTHAILHGKTKKDLYGGHKDIYLINPEGLP